MKLLNNQIVKLFFTIHVVKCFRQDSQIYTDIISKKEFHLRKSAKSEGHKK